MPHNTQLQGRGELSKHFKVCSRISPLRVLFDVGRRREKGPNRSCRWKRVCLLLFGVR